MSTLPASSTALATSGRKATMQLLGEQNVAVRLDAEGFLTRVQRTVRIKFGTEAYAAPRGDLGPGDKVQCQQSGYMKMVAGMGGQLSCPPRIKHAVTGEMMANPVVEFYPDSAIIKSSKALAVCAVRNPVTGEWHVSTGEVTVDTEHVFRQALLKLVSGSERPDAVQFMTRAEFDADAVAMKGWAFLPSGPIGIAYNMRLAFIRSAYQTFLEQSATARQRSMTKAERLAADHNPITRRTWYYGEFTKPEKGAEYMDVPVVAWVESRGREQVEAFVASMARAHDAIEGVAEVIHAAADDDGDEIDNEYEPETQTLIDRGPTQDPLEGFRQPERERVVVEALAETVAPVAEVAPAPDPKPAKPKADPKPKEDPKPKPPAEVVTPTPAAPISRSSKIGGEAGEIIAEIDLLESKVTAAEADQARAAVGIDGSLSSSSIAKLRALLDALRSA